MRGSLLLLFLLLLPVGAAGSCHTAAPAPSPPPEPVPEVDLAFAAEDFARGSSEAEAYLAAAGSEALPWVRPLLDSEDPDVRRRALSLVLDSGEDMGVTVEERVDLLLYELTRSDPGGWSSLRAIGRLRALGEEARPGLEAAARRSDERGAAARRLLEVWEVPR